MQCRRTAQRSVLSGCPESAVRAGDIDVCPPGSPPAQTLITGQGAHYRASDPKLSAWTTASPARAESMRRFRMHSVMMVPLRARGITLGVMHLLRHRTAETFTELIVSELVTNAVRYGSEPIELRLIRADVLICEVSDSSSTAPHLRRARVFDEGGRGLLLVAQVAERWGSRHTSTGKTIWAEQPLPD